MKKYLGFTLVMVMGFPWQRLQAQPFLDLFRAGFYYSPQPGLGKKSEPVNATVWNASFTLPIEFKKGGDALLVNPFYEYNFGARGDEGFRLQSHGLMMGFLKKFRRDKFELLASLIGRINKEAGTQPRDRSQIGTVLLGTWNLNRSLSIKAGMYYNREFFGDFFMPLGGIDWKIDKRNSLFGTLPGSLTLEHRVNHAFYYGLAFRALTNSWRIPASSPVDSVNYIRINDNQLGIFGDIYLNKSIVCTVETGYTAFRNYRSGFRLPDMHLFRDWKSDNYYIRLSLAYRLRFR